VLPVVGELTEINFGIKDDVLQKLYDEVNIVYHVAATIRFNSHIATSIKINLVGTKVVIDFAKSLKSLASFIYVSTAFCNSCYLNENIKEQVYPTERDPYEMMKLVDKNNNHDELPQTGTKELQELLKDHPNTYSNFLIHFSS
jgi:alcohol-forming fatty acyl-CoA reductase